MLFKVLLLLLSACSIQGYYDEPLRPQLHFTAEKGWINDPNGLVFYDGTFHLFYQYYPDDIVPGHMYWGHATSQNLVFWQHQPIALSPTNEISIFSGSAIVDYQNISGLQTGSNKVMLALFTAHQFKDNQESQWIAQSQDSGQTWAFYPDNPVIPNSGQRDFRDPNIFQYNSTHFVLVLAAGNHVEFYGSSNLLEWGLLSEFGDDQGAHSGVWECPDLFPLKVQNETGQWQEKWVLTVSTFPTIQYFIGEFNGETFFNDNTPDLVLWVDSGAEAYAGVTYNQEPTGRRIFIEWMSRPDYATSLPTSPWRGQHSFPRELSLKRTSNDLVRLASKPIGEIWQAANNTWLMSGFTLNPNEKHYIEGLNSQILNLKVQFNQSNAAEEGRFGVQFGNDSNLIVFFNIKDSVFVVDRTNAGDHNFSNAFPQTITSKRIIQDPTINLEIIIDIATIEVFADDGLNVLSNLFFSKETFNSEVTIFYESQDENSSLDVESLVILELNSIWNS